MKVCEASAGMFCTDSLRLRLCRQELFYIHCFPLRLFWQKCFCIYFFFTSFFLDYADKNCFIFTIFSDYPDKNCSTFTAFSDYPDKNCSIFNTFSDYPDKSFSVFTTFSDCPDRSFSVFTTFLWDCAGKNVWSFVWLLLHLHFHASFSDLDLTWRSQGCWKGKFCQLYFMSVTIRSSSNLVLCI